MKMITVSLVAAMAVSGLSAVENTKVEGYVKLWYQTGTTSASDAVDMFDKEASTGNMVAELRATGDLTDTLSYGVTLDAASTMGMDGNIISSPILTDSENTNGEAAWPVWLSEAYVTYKAGNTVAKFGRQQLGTPLAYSEICSCAPVANTFEAVALINSDIPDTTLVAAVVSKGNSQGDVEVNPLAANGGLNPNGRFAGYHALHLEDGDLGLGDESKYNHNGGAFVLGAVNTSIENLTVTPFYYNIKETAGAFWIDGVYAASSFKVQALYANLDADGKLSELLDALSITEQTTSAYAIQASADVAGWFDLILAYADTSEGFLPVANTANNFATSPVYTAGHIGGTQTSAIAGAPDVSSYKVNVQKVVGETTWSAAVHMFDLGENVNGGGTGGYYALDSSLDPISLELYVKTKVEDVNIIAAYIRENEYAVDGAGDAIDQDTFRIAARIDF